MIDLCARSPESLVDGQNIQVVVGLRASDEDIWSSLAC